MASLFCFGLGYSAGFLAETVRGEGWAVAGTSREEPVPRIGVPFHPFTRDRPLVNPAKLLAGVTHVLVSVPPDAVGDPVLDEHGADLATIPSLAWLGYLSTTGVYGDWGGGWVDERSAVEPSGERGRRRCAAEAGWLGSGLPVHIFRLAGIYGPGRNALAALREGRARRIVKPGQVFSRIHVADLVAVLRASMASPDPGAVYNVADDEPAPPEDVVAFAADLLGLPPPPAVPFAAAELSPIAASFYEDSKRVRNERIKAELGIRLRYPTYREGLRALLSDREAS